MARRRKITLLFHLKQNPDGTSLRVGLFAFGIISCRRHHLGVDPETAGTGSWVLRFIDCHPVPGWPRGSGKSSAQSSLPPAFVCTFYYTCSVLFRFFVLFGRKKTLPADVWIVHLLAPDVGHLPRRVGLLEVIITGSRTRTKVSAMKAAERHILVKYWFEKLCLSLLAGFSTPRKERALCPGGHYECLQRVWKQSLRIAMAFRAFCHF